MPMMADYFVCPIVRFMRQTLPQRDYTPQEAAALSGVRLRRIQNALTDGQLGDGSPVVEGGRRRIDLPAVLTFAALDRLGPVRIDPAALYRAFRGAEAPVGLLAVTESVTVDAGRLLANVIRNVAVYEIARERIVSDPDVMGGLPVVRGTRIPARSLHARIAGGDSVESIIEDYPYLDNETIEAAVMFAKANPERGRPRVS
jgi:uncharacterized protein (DUF433 family)